MLPSVGITDHQREILHLHYEVALMMNKGILYTIEVFRLDCSVTRYV